MNKIYKKIWNKARGCFVAVAEVVMAASQKGGKTTLVLGMSLFFSGGANALVTINGDVIGTEGLSLQGRGLALADSHIIKGSFTWNKSLDDNWDNSLDVSIGAGFYSFLSNTLTVEKDLKLTNNSSLGVAHNGDKGGELHSALIVNGNFIIDSGSGFRVITNGGSGNDPTVYASVTVHGTVYNNGLFGSDNTFDASRTHGSVAINQLVNNGTFYLYSPNTFNASFNNIIQNGGDFHQANENDFHVTGSFVVNGGIIYNNDTLAIGGDIGKFSVVQRLELAGGGVSNLSTLTQNQGTFQVTRGSYSIGTLNKANGTTTVKGTLAVTNFNQSGGSTSNTGNLSIGNSDLYGSLTSSGTLTLTGNVTSRGNLSSTGTLNNRGNWTETNAYNIVGNLNNSGSINFQNGFTFASNGKLNSSGTIQTNNASNIFDSLGSQRETALTTVSVNAQLPEEAKTALTDLFRHYVPGSVAQNLVDHATFSGGKVIVTGVNLTQTQADDLKKEFKSKFFSFQQKFPPALFNKSAN